MSTSKKNKGKKVINQDELRRLMREKQRQTTDKKRVESPYAKYNSLGHLSCVVCNVQVKSELLWPTHILGKQHKEKVLDLKSSKQSIASQGPQPPLKRKTLVSEVTNVEKKSKYQVSAVNQPGLPVDFFEDAEKPTCSAPKNLGLSLLAGTYDEEDGNEEEKSDAEAPQSSIQKDVPAPGLPDDFFDGSIPSVLVASHSGSILKADEPEVILERKDNTAEALPEGFFDDPVRDAKVRNVDAPKDLLDKEYDEFQKEMRQVNTKSEAIVAEDDEEGRLERQIDEIDEQIECYRRVELLRNKQDVVRGNFVKEKTRRSGFSGGSDEEEEEDEEELLHLLSRDWRAKGALA